MISQAPPGTDASTEAPFRPDVIYHIAVHADWAVQADCETTGRAGIYAGGDACKRDGFMHFSTLDQVPGTLARFYRGRNGLVLLALETENLGDRLRWEEASGGGVFPHYYGVLDRDEFLVLGEITLGRDGAHVLPAVLKRDIEKS